MLDWLVSERQMEGEVYWWHTSLIPALGRLTWKGFTVKEPTSREINNLHMTVSVEDGSIWYPCALLRMQISTVAVGNNMEVP